MKQHSTTHLYFEWLCRKVCKTTTKINRYSQLLETLHSIEFIYYIPMDANRLRDGEDLRYRFARRFGVEPTFLSDSCSVLEMLVALAIRCEEQIMDDPEKGNRTSIWFWEMIENLGLHHMTNDNYNEQVVRDVIDCLLERRYDPDGTGGLFTINNCRYDLRKVEIWYQMCWYLNYIL